MAREQFINKKFSAGSLSIISAANVILKEYTEQGLVLTLRQLYYQFVARDMLPNKQSEYKRLGAIVSDARLAGLIDWAMMEDRTRTLRHLSTWADPEEIIDGCARGYREDLWEGQKFRPEVWIEKDALLGVIERACQEMRVDYFACRGYASQSAQYETGLRYRQYRRNGQTPVILHLGDHDPSGIDMTRDNADRVGMFTKMGVTVRRIALNMDQVHEFNPPPNPAKESDGRFAAYALQFGNESWELDALEPRVIDRLIRQHVSSLINQPKWDASIAEEKRNRAMLQKVSTNWSDVEELLSDR